MAIIYITESGSAHRVDHQAKLYTRVPKGTHPLQLRQDGVEISFRDVNFPQVGDCLVLMLEPLGEGEATLRLTAPVVEIVEE